ncbi:hypothetical protein IEQ34_015120 [Dendrobium chrysotoxum]|uniref:CRM domain-containing protein n=1 Tax=Dendrobium chrysotoxum TaxID=161865 RepID=A0AAV7GNC7_DENCH|nr:hypothetical protein IEQ34_015120 [Dendrobium chrysotoxum]
MALASTAFFYRFPGFPSSPVCSYLQKFLSTSLLLPSSIPLQPQLLLLSRSSRPFTSTSSSFLLAAQLHRRVEHGDSGFPIISDTEDEEKLWEEEEEEEEEDESLTEQPQATERVNASLPSFPTPKITIKEKKELASYAHSLGKKLKSQQVGKSGVTPTVAAAMVEALEANELLKLKIHGSCPGELSDVVKQLETATGSAAVGQIGRTVILYRPSLTKIKNKNSDRRREQQQTKSVKSVTMLKVPKKTQATRTFSRS